METSRDKKALTGIQEAIRLDRQKKEVMLASLRREKESRQRALKELEQAAQRLQKMMDELARRPAGPSRDAPAGTRLQPPPGQLPYPGRGAGEAGLGPAQ